MLRPPRSEIGWFVSQCQVGVKVSVGLNPIGYWAAGLMDGQGKKAGESS